MAEVRVQGATETGFVQCVIEDNMTRQYSLEAVLYCIFLKFYLVVNVAKLLQITLICPVDIGSQSRMIAFRHGEKIKVEHFLSGFRPLISRAKVRAQQRQIDGVQNCPEFAGHGM